MERKYFPINESNAKAAHNMMSMRDYAEADHDQREVCAQHRRRKAERNGGLNGKIYRISLRRGGD